ncbi:MAG: CinA family protein [Arcobacteraceae bacterium]
MFDELFNETQMQELQKLLRQHKKTITCAESCTGGLVASLITELSGSSDIFNGSIVSYSNEIKMQELNVEKNDLEKFGAVSEEVVSQMLDGALSKFKANYAIAVSGIAGPSGGTLKKPVGTVIIGIASANAHKMVVTYQFKGDRKEVQMQAAKTSFCNLLNFLRKDLTK